MAAASKMKAHRVTSDITDTLAERGARYGDYFGKAMTIQDLKATMAEAPKWQHLPADMKESLETIATKIGRILWGDPSYVDNWHDIGGYAKLIEDRLND